MKGTLNYKIVFHNIKLLKVNLIMFADAFYASDPDTARSVSGYILQLGSMSTISWSSKKQSCIVKSTCEAEYMTCSYTVSQLIWMKAALKELNFSCISQLCTDSQSVISIIKDHCINTHMKHITVHYHYTQKHHAKKSFTVMHVPSVSNLTDICIKALPLLLLHSLTKGIMNIVLK